MTWDRRLRRWASLTTEQRGGCLKKFADSLRARIAKARKKSLRRVHDARYSDIRSLVGFHSIHFEYRSLERFVQMLERLPWREP